VLFALPTFTSRRLSGAISFTAQARWVPCNARLCHHGLRKGTSVFNLAELLFEHCRPLQSVRESEVAPHIVRE
jgi:hypothetical protein